MLETFSTGLDSFLTKDQIREIAPVILAQAPTAKVSSQYVFANAEVIIDDLAKLGWYPVSAVQRKQKGDTPSRFSKFSLSFQNPDLKIEGKDGDDAFPRIILMSSHDGLQAFKFYLGLYRLICSNGLVVADQEFSSFRIQHKGYSFEDLRGLVADAVKQLPERVAVMNEMSERILTRDEQMKLAEDALLLRVADKEKVLDTKVTFDTETLEDILTPIRELDKGDSLWKVFNVIQEKVIRGGFTAALTGEKARKVRPIKGFERDVQVNKELFQLAVSYL